MTEIRKVAATIDMVWSLEKQEYIPEVGKGDLALNVDRINPELFKQGVLVLVDSEAPKASKQQKTSAAEEPKEE